MKHIRIIILFAVVLFSVYGCRTVKPGGGEVRSDQEETETLMKELDQGYGFAPYYRSNSSAFSSKGVLEMMEEVRKREIIKEKEKFRRKAEERFKGVENVYWVPPPENPKLYLALKVFPKDAFGYPDWTSAVKKGIIAPLDTVLEEPVKSEIFNKAIIFKINDRMMANVRFPHEIHNYWLSCKVCHPGIFIAKQGANVFGMTDIWNGQFCGRCHGRVAFQPKGFENCIRCHSVRRQKVVF